MEAEEAAFELFALVDTASPTPQTPPDSRSARLVAAANEALIAGYAEPLRVAGIAHELGVSPSYLARIYRTHEGSPLHQRLTRLRVAAALARLNAGEPNLTKLALDVGFSSHSHFTSAFKRLVGACPKDYRLASQI
jgi:AraC-like DNA-binding protein